MNTLLFPGSFDPFTLGHRDIAKRASKLCDRLVISVMQNDAKHPVFSLTERVDMVKESLKGFDNIEVMSYEGLLVDLYKEIGCSASVRGIRSESDFRYEAEMALANRLLYPEYDVILLPCRAELSLTSSSIVKEVGFYGGDITKMVPKEIQKQVSDKLMKGRK